MKKAIYPGTFDPVTNGHIDLIRRAAKLFPTLIVAVANNQPKSPMLSLETRIACVKAAVHDLPHVEVHGFRSLLVDFAKSHHAGVLVRGLRAASDFEHEFQLAGMNRKLDKQLETVFLTPSEDCMFISSTLVREIAALNGDISRFVPSAVVDALKASRPQAAS